METLIIDRKTWRTGDYGRNKTGDGDTKLFNNEGYMCCLGFECLRRGFSKEQILNMYGPCDLDDNPLSGQEGEKFVTDAININDDVNSTLKEKEAQIKKLFAEHNIDVQFIN